MSQKIELDFIFDGTVCCVAWCPLTGLEAPKWASPSEQERAADLCAMAWGRLQRAVVAQGRASLTIPDRYTGVKS